MLLLAIVQVHRELHSPFLSAAAETSTGIYRGFLVSLSVQSSGKGLQLSSKDCSSKSNLSSPAGIRFKVPGCFPEHPPAASPCYRQSFIQLSYGLVIKETKFPSVAFSSSQERQLQYPAMLLQQTKSKCLPRSLSGRSHHNGHHNHDTKFDVTDTRINLELLFHTTEEIPRKKLMEMGLVEGEAPTRVIASFFQTSGELGAGTANTNNQA